MGWIDFTGLGGFGAGQSVLNSVTGAGGPETKQYQGNADLTQFGVSPYSSALQASITNMQGPQSISPANMWGIYAAGNPYKEDTYKAKDMSSASLPQYDAMRKRLESQYSQQQSQGQDAIDRQFAAMGGGPGNGAQLKQTENLAGEIAKQKGNDLEAINAQEAADRQRLQEQESQKEFQSAETQKGYGFQAAQADTARRQAAASEAAQLGLSAQEFNAQQQQAFNQFQFGANSTIAGLNTAWDQAQAESRNNEFNKVLSEWQARHSGGLGGGGGYLGLGLFS